jgi:hypothetical protein
MAPFLYQDKVKAKIKELHEVEIEEVREAFLSHIACNERFIEETRKEHLKVHKKLWFIAETDQGRLLKVVLAEEGDSLELVTAYDPDEEDINYYEKVK